MNVDAAWKPSPPSTGIGAMCRDSSGRVVGASSTFFDMDVKNPIAELIAILEGMKLAKALRCEVVEVESDSVQAVKLILKEQEIWGEVEAVVEEIWQKSLEFSRITFSHISMDVNNVADIIAKKARMDRICEPWVESYPGWLVSSIEADHFSFAHVAV
ncbi:MAG: reverse transcriptase-like protein [Sweet potato little leaf phytoplasma]|nr:reverse transcriptase-like protein [Sweet potato little leaf phytoplasma]